MDIKDLLNKQANPEQKDYVIENGIPDNQVLSAEEFVEGIVKPISSLQDKVKTLETKSVFGIKLGVTTYSPENNIVSLPGADSQVGVYLDLATAEDGSMSIISTTGKLQVGIRPISTIGGSDTGETVTITVNIAAEGSTDWMERGKFQMNTRSYNSNAFEVKDLTQYVSRGRFNVQLVATGNRTGVTGYSQVFNVVLTSMYLTNQRGYESPINTKVDTRFPVRLMVYGIVQKDLHIKISGERANYETTYTLNASEDGVQKMYNIDDEPIYGILSHGVHKLEAWLTCSDGQGGVLESEHIVNRFMVVNEDDAKENDKNLLKPYIMLQNDVRTATNFVQSKLFDYSVYYPVQNEDTGEITNDGKDLSLIFMLTDYTPDYFEQEPEEYFRIEAKGNPNTSQELRTAVEIESEEESMSYDSYLRIFRVMNDGSYVDMVRDAAIEFSGDDDNIYIKVDNTNSFAPTTGSVFLLNPKVRNNGETNPARILNSRKNNVEVESVWDNFGFVNDGWVTNSSDKQKVLRIPANSQLNIKYNPFRQFLTSPNSAMTIEMDIAVRNVTNEKDPIIQLCEVLESTGDTIGLQIMPMRGIMYTARNLEASQCDFTWQEGERTHITINIHNAVRSNMDDAYLPNSSDEGIQADRETYPYVRVFINGGIEREMVFNTTNRNEFCTGELSNGGFIIGQSGADIDIYSIRVFENQQLSAEDIERDYRSTMPTSEEKLAHDALNSIRSGGRVDIEKVKKIGKRCLIWHGEEPYYYASANRKGWWEIFQYNADGSLNKDLSGTLCKETKSLEMKGQGSTAKTYYYWNGQTDLSKVKSTIEVALTDLHSSITVGEIVETEKDGEPTGEFTIQLTGGNLGDKFPAKKDFKTYPYDPETNLITVPDGWIDGNNKYRGPYYIVKEGIPLAQKLVNKINYASAMQSHLAGCTKAYSVLHTAVVGKNKMQADAEKNGTSAMVAKHTEPFFYFTQAEAEGSPILFRGLSTFGAGKMDKATWGYVKKQHPMFCMIEGADNNNHLTDFRVPWDKDVTYNVGEESFQYAGKLQWDFDAGATYSEDDEAADPNHKTDHPKENILNRIKEVWNWVYMHTPMIEYYVGTYDNFKNSPEAENITRKYWCTAGADAYMLKRYNHATNAWVDAGMWNEETETYDKIDVRSDETFFGAYEASANKSKFKELNDDLIKGIVAHAKKYMKFYFNEKSVQFHYCFINHLMAGTDNCSKNTYFIINPEAEEITIDGETRQCYRVHMHQDDVDTIGPTDNNGRNTKPYYIDRMHPYSDEGGKSNYEGENNAFFNLVELMYEDSGELTEMMGTILTTMQSSMSVDDDLVGFTGNTKISVWGFYYKYFFATQNYFPVAAYNEQARVRYEYPEMIGYVSRGDGGRTINPITQSVGAQLQAEIQYYKRRLVLMAGYGSWVGAGHDIGISGSGDAWSPMMYPRPDSEQAQTTYKFTVTPHQYLYPCGSAGMSKFFPHVRVKPGEQFVLDLGSANTKDTGLALYFINYYRSIGNVGDISLSNKYATTVIGARLTEFIAEPTKTYPNIEGDKPEQMVPLFRPASIAVQAPNIERISIPGCVLIGGELDLTSLTRLQYVNNESTNIGNVSLPSSTNLREVHLNDKLRNLTLENLPNLNVFTLQSYKNLSSFEIGENVPNLDSYSIMAGAYAEGAIMLNVSLGSVYWEECDVKMLEWMMSFRSIKMTGIINVYEQSTITPSISFDIKKRINEFFGNVDDLNSPDNKGLHIVYMLRQFTSAEILGVWYRDEDNIYGGKFPMSLKPSNNNVNAFTKIEWSITPATKGGEWSIDSKTGVITVTKLSTLKDSAVVTCTITCYYEGQYSTYETNKTLEIYDKKVQIGDYVYADGTYSDMLDENKTVVGMCFFIAPGLNEGEVDPTFMNPNDKLLRFMISTEFIRYSNGLNYTETIMPFGCTQRNGTYGMYYTDSSGKLKFFDGVEQGFTQNTFYAIEDITKRSTDQINVKDSTLRDTTSNTGIKNDGFALFKASDSLGAGMACEESLVLLNSRTMTKELAELTNGLYKEGDIVNEGYINTLKIIKHRNAILNTGLSHPEGGMIFPPLRIPADNKNTTELTDLFECCKLLIEFMKSKGDPNPTVWAQSYYPVVSAAYAYEPHGLKENEKLNVKFSKRNWFLPPYQFLIRLIWYFYTDESNNVFKRAVKDGICEELVIRVNRTNWWFGGGNSSYEYLPTAHQCSDGLGIIIFDPSNSINPIFRTLTMSYGYKCRPICAF